MNTKLQKSSLSIKTQSQELQKISSPKGTQNEQLKQIVRFKSQGQYKRLKSTCIAFMMLILVINFIFFAFAYYHFSRQYTKPEQCGISREKIPKDRNRLSYTERINSSTPQRSFRRSFPEQPANIVFHPRFKMYLKNHADYLSKNNVATVLQINCNSQCMQRLEKLEKNFQVTYASANFTELSGNYDWIVIRQMNIQQKMVALANIAAENVKKGVTIFLKNIQQLRNFNARYRDFVFQTMKYYGLEYDEAASLNIRRPQGRIVLIFNRNRIKSSFPFKKPIKNNIAIQEVLILRENLPYMRQWIGYHIYLGVDKFFIYDNNGSQGEPGYSTDQQNKYGFKFGCLNLTQEKIIQQWDSIWQQFYEHIIYVPWQQTLNGKIIYGQVESQADFMDFFEDTTSYVGFIDADQMLFSEKNLNFTNFLAWHSLYGNTGLSMMQKKYSNRYCLLHQRMIEINQTYFVTTYRGEAQKLFSEMDNFCPWGSIHDGTVYNGKKYFLPDATNFRFNHYNLIIPFIKYFQAHGRSTETKISFDNSGKQRYGKVMQEICKGKCSESFKSLCDLTSIQCPKMDQEYFKDPNVNYNIRKFW